MAKCVTISSLHKYSWDQIASLFWQRYPNPYSKHVLSEDTICREVRDGKLYTKRLIYKTLHKAPRWAERFVSHVYIVEESVVDPQSNVITTYTRNICHKNLMLIEEKCDYKVSTDNLLWTLWDKKAYIKSTVFGLSRALQAYGVQKFPKNCKRSAKGLDYILARAHPDQAEPAAHIYTKDKLRDAALEKARRAKEIARASCPPPILQAKT